MLAKPYTYMLLGATAAFLGCGNQSDEGVVTKTDEGTTATAAGDVADDRGTSFVRVINAVPNKGAITVRTGDGLAFDKVDYKTVTPYREIRENTVTFSVLGGDNNPININWDAMRRGIERTRDRVGDAVTNDRRTDTTTGGRNNTNAGNQNPGDSNVEILMDGERYTVVVMPDDEGTGVRLRVLHDELEFNDDEARIRFIHAVPRVGELDLMRQGTNDPIFDDVNFGMEAGFDDVDPGSGTWRVRRDEGERTLVTLNDLKALQAGRAYTIVVAGTQGKYDVITFEDASATNTTGGGNTPGGMGTDKGGRKNP